MSTRPTPIDRSKNALTVHSKAHPVLGPQRWPGNPQPAWQGQPSYRTSPDWEPARPGATDYRRCPSLGQQTHD